MSKSSKSSTNVEVASKLMPSRVVAYSMLIMSIIIFAFVFILICLNPKLWVNNQVTLTFLFLIIASIAYIVFFISYSIGVHSRTVCDNKLISVARWEQYFTIIVTALIGNIIFSCILILSGTPTFLTVPVPLRNVITEALAALYLFLVFARTFVMVLHTEVHLRLTGNALSEVLARVVLFSLLRYLFDITYLSSAFGALTGLLIGTGVILMFGLGIPMINVCLKFIFGKQHEEHSVRVLEIVISIASGILIMSGLKLILKGIDLLLPLLSN